MKEYWKVVVPVVSLFFLASVYFTSTALSYVGEVLIINSATEPIKNGQVEVCGQKFQLGEIGQGKTKAIQYKVRSDSHFALIVEFVSGKKVSKELGYVTSGRDFKHVLTLKDDEVSIELQ
ncbi:MAG: hypothetical protein H8K07_01125 [Nitrospira sp.]|jgi:hypothetical protein|nr:hypothetical protein [Nitrospira sp.]MDI3465364.1 hypothetical protein [Nitrospira sp.]